MIDKVNKLKRYQVNWWSSINDDNVSQDKSYDRMMIRGKLESQKALWYRLLIRNASDKKVLQGQRNIKFKISLW